GLATFPMLSFFSKRGSTATDSNAQAWAALARSDPERLHSLALSAPTEDVRLSAVQVIDDQATLAMVVRKEPGKLAREVAIQRITDPEYRISLATDPMLPEELRLMALEGLGPDPRLCAIYRPAASEALRTALLTVLG